jgi:hypothetical protein
MAQISRRKLHGRSTTKRRLAEELADKLLALPDPEFLRAVAAAEEAIGPVHVSEQEDKDRAYGSQEVDPRSVVKDDRR